MEKNKFSFTVVKGVPKKATLLELELLYKSIFDDADLNFFNERINSQENICSIIAFKNKKPIGFKIGYHYNNSTFYSWVGGVLKAYRCNGVGKKLAQMQEHWAKENNYFKIRTKSMNRFKPMMILNLKNDFNIVSIYTNATNQTKIVFEKEI